MYRGNPKRSAPYSGRGVSELSSTGHLPELASLLDNVPRPWDRVNGWVDQARLRPESEIAHQREVTDIWYWRLGAEIARRVAPLSDKLSFEDAIREVVAESQAAGYTIDAARGDFAVSGRLVRDLTAESSTRWQPLPKNACAPSIGSVASAPHGLTSRSRFDLHNGCDHPSYCIAFVRRYHIRQSSN